jgi:benzoyl-CoA-dihydrodiol lyase
VDHAATQEPQAKIDAVDFQTDPARYKHWRLSFDGPVATLTMDVAEDGGIRPGYKLKLNSYDLGVDIELHDALQRIRFEHPEVRSVVFASAKNRIFCSGANIYMLGLSSHAWKVNFCKFTNETRNGIEDASAHSGLKFLAALNGTTAGGGYELALACDEIVLIDDRSSAVSLPELPLLGVLPGTGGLTRVTDKRKVRRDHADVFCTNPDGVRGQRAKDWRLVDEIVKPQQFAEHIKQRARRLAEQSDRPTNTTKGVNLTPLEHTADENGRHYKFVDVQYNREARTATISVRAPESATETTVEKALAAGASWWPLQMARELDDAILTLRSSELDLGLWILKTAGNPDAVIATDDFLLAHQDNWFVREVLGMLRRTFARIDVTSRSLFALIEPNSCFAGSLLELALAADRVYMRDVQEGEAASVALSKMNFGALPMTNHLSRLAARYYQDGERIEGLRSRIGKKLSAKDALEAGLVTSAPDDLDWEDELRQAIESRAAQSPDALTGLEANLRFGGTETLETRIFGRLSAWQNWIFIRPNAVGPSGALKVYGSGSPVKFNWEKV